MATKNNREQVAIIGSGPVGSLLAIYLAKRGYKVDIYERRPDMRRGKIPAGRSINLALSDRGWRGLDGADIADNIRKIAIPMRGRMIHHPNGQLDFQPYGKEGQAIYSVSRAAINIALMNAAEQYREVRIFFNHRCTDIDLDKGEITLADENLETKGEGKIFRKQYALLFAADGAFSAVRYKMQTLELFNYSQQYIEHGYKEFTIEAGENGQWLMEKNALHIWPRKRFMLIALPNLNGSFTCTLFLPFQGNPSFSSIQTENDLLAFFKEHFADALPLMPTLQQEYFSNPTGSLLTIRCYPWSYQDKVLLIGDAAHAIVPFFGQGMNAGFEDCTILNSMIDKHGDNWGNVFQEFQQARKPDADAIAELALQNFVEMRDKVADPLFLFRKKLEQKLHDRYPTQFIPLYSLVTFSHIPYSKAKEIGEREDKLMEQIMAIPDIKVKWEHPETQKQIQSLIQTYLGENRV